MDENDQKHNDDDGGDRNDGNNVDDDTSSGGDDDADDEDAGERLASYPFLQPLNPDRTAQIESAATKAKHELADADNDEKDHTMMMMMRII